MNTGTQDGIWLNRLSSWRNVLGSLAVLLTVVAIAVLVLDLRLQINILDDSATDNMQFTLGQTEVELMALEIAALRVATGKATLDDVRLRYDVFYSRVQTLKESKRFEALHQFDIIPARIAQIAAFRDRWLPVIDGPDSDLLAGLPEMGDEARIVRETVREATLAGVEFFSQQGYVQRKSLRQSMTRVGFLTVGLLAMMAVLSLALFRFARRSDAEARQNRETRERIETILSTSLDAVIVSNSAGQIIDYNGAAERIFGYSRTEAINADLADLIVPDNFRAAHRAGMARFQRGELPRMIGRGIVRLDAKRRDGRIFPIDFSLARAQSPDGEIYVAFLRDISDRVRSEAALRRARDRAIAGEKQKAELLAVMSHEMRTPLNGMLGTLELVDAAALDKRHQRFLRIVKDSGKILLRHVNDVLDISRLDAGKMSLRKTGFDLVTLLSEIVDNQCQNATARGNKMVLVPPNPELHRVYGDPDRLHQILLNLISNAIKFTRNGRITIEADCSNGLDEVELRVTDTGVGIEAADLDRVFEDFATIDNTYGRSSSGTGLGLGISQRLATAMDGELGVESEPGDGSVFWLRLPLAPPDQGRAQTPVPERELPSPAAVPPPCHILLVEDNEINRIVGRELLEYDGHKVTTASSGEQALDIAQTGPFDVILMDISMPGMDGIDVARALRRADGANGRTPIIATTAHALPQEIDAFHAAGMQAVLIKPLTLDAIRRALGTGLESDLGRSVSLDLSPRFDQIIDRSHLRDMEQNLTPPRFLQVRGRFVTEMNAVLAAMPGWIKAGSMGCGPMAAEAHRMAGSASVLGATDLTELLKTLQTQAGGADETTLTGLHKDLTKCWGATRAALELELGTPQQPQ